MLKFSFLFCAFTLAQSDTPLALYTLSPEKREKQNNSGSEANTNYLSFFRASLPEFYAKRLTRAVLTHMKLYK